MKVTKIGLLPRIIFAIAVGIGLGVVVPPAVVRTFLTFNGIFSQFLGFSIPLIILALVADAIGSIGKQAGKMLLLTVALAYGSTILSGFMAFASGDFLFPQMISSGQTTQLQDSAQALTPYFTIDIPPVMEVMTALVLAFVFGLGVASLKSDALRNVITDTKDIVSALIDKAIIPLLPLYILGIFMEMASSGKVLGVLIVFIKIIGIIFALHIILLLLQFSIAGIIQRKNPLLLLWRMMPAYFTALGTSSSAATIPVTLEQSRKNGVSDGVSGFVIPLCATIHLSGSMLKITSCALALMMMSGIPYTLGHFIHFIMLLGITMVAAPGVPGGAIMAALPILGSVLGFTAEQQGLMISLYITMDSFGTACNVTGDGAIALVVDKLMGRKPTTPLSDIPSTC